MRYSLQRVLGYSGLAAGLSLAACADTPTGAAVRAAAAVESYSGGNELAAPGAAVQTPPAVLVKDGSGRGLAGQTVQFVVTRGGGTVENQTATTNTAGIATAGRWTLGPVQGVNEVQAKVGALAPLSFTATALASLAPPTPVTPPPATPATGAFSIVTRYVGTATARQQEAVSAAIARWQSVIVADLPNIPLNAQANACFTGQPALNEAIDDVLIFVEFIEIDGIGKVLGEAGPCYIRTDSGLPIVGHLKLDAADLERMEITGTLNDVVLHEIGHVLGIGTLWPRAALIAGAGTDDPHFTGVNGHAEYRGLGGTAVGPPIENTGEPGTRDGHWRETVFGNELMTGYINGTSNPLSALTIASLKDLGYGASTSGASAYSLGGHSSGIVEAVDLRGGERIKKPKYKVDRKGNQRPVDAN